MNTIKMVKKFAAVAIAAVTIGFAPSAWASERECVQLWADGPYFATCNIGAENPEESGCFFWWGDTVGYTNFVQTVGKKTTRKWVSVVDGTTTTSFISSKAPTYGKNVETLQGEGWLNDDGNLVLSDDATVNRDAARAHWGSSWRMPTGAEIEKLADTAYCTATWVENWNDTGVNGFVVTGATDGYTDKSIFLPAAGHGDTSTISSLGGRGQYLSSSANSSTSTTASLYYSCALYFTPSSFKKNDTFVRRYWGASIRPVCDTPPGAVVESAEEVVAKEELVLWEGEAVVDNWDKTGNQPFLLTGGGAVLKNAGAYVGQEIRFYVTPTGDVNADGYENWWCDIVGGNWDEGVYVQRCALGCYNDGDPTRTEWDLGANGGYISFTLTQEMLDFASQKGAGAGVFQANGDDSIITKITLVDPRAPEVVEPAENPVEDLEQPLFEDDEVVIWKGEAVADSWGKLIKQPYFLVSNAAEMLGAADAYEGQEVRIYITPTEKEWWCDILQGDWGKPDDFYASHCAVGCYDPADPNRTEFDLEANGGYISFTLTAEMLEFAKDKESWAGLFVANADNVIITKIALVNEEAEPEVDPGEEEPEVKDYPAYIPEADKAKYDAWVDAFCIADRIDSEAALQNAYLLNVAPADAERAMAEFRITSITVNADESVTITVSVPERTYNGTVEIIGAETVGGDYTAAKVTAKAARFFKAILK